MTVQRDTDRAGDPRGRRPDLCYHLLTDPRLVPPRTRRNVGGREAGAFDLSSLLPRGQVPADLQEDCAQHESTHALCCAAERGVLLLPRRDQLPAFCSARIRVVARAMLSAM